MDELRPDFPPVSKKATVRAMMPVSQVMTQHCKEVSLPIMIVTGVASGACVAEHETVDHPLYDFAPPHRAM